MDTIDIESVVLEARDLILQATTVGTQEVPQERIKTLYNRQADEQTRVTPLEFSLACTLAIGAVAEQKGGNIVSAAARDNLTGLLWEAQDALGVGV